MAFGIEPFPVKQKEHRELLIAHDFCPECGGDLDTGYECNDCAFDARDESRKMDIDKHHKDKGGA